MTSYRYNLALEYDRIAASFADRPALIFSEARIVTHGELNAFANRLAHCLSDRGLAAGSVLAIVHTKTAFCYAAMLAALKLGAAYVNIDEQNPVPRLTHIFSTARPQIVAGEALPDNVRDVAASFSCLQLTFDDASLASDMANAKTSTPDAAVHVTGSDVAYIMYTSGSTGVPKGAMMTHANVMNFGAWIAQRFGITETDVLSNVNPMYFDNSVFDFYGAMLNGAALAPVSRESVSRPELMLTELEAAGCTSWFSVPSMLIYLMTLRLLGKHRLPHVRRFVFGGEGYPRPELRKLFDLFGDRSEFINVYGPTECTCMCSAWTVTPEDLKPESGLVTLGPIAENFAALVLDGDVPVEPGEVGELSLLGPQVGLGYANDRERTDASFAPNPLNKRWNERMYRTGDLVRISIDGRMLDFVGRKDNQVKHMGYRIELEEIEAAMQTIEGVHQAAAVLKSGRRGMATLVGYAAAANGASEASLRNAVSAILPPYMVPQRFVVREQLPKNANGKVDRVRLAAEPLEG